MGTVGGRGNDSFILGPIEFKKPEGPLHGISQQNSSRWCRKPNIIQQMQRLPILLCC